MSRTTISNGESGATVRAAINTNFQEVYGGIGIFKTIAGRWYLPFWAGALAAGANMTANSLRAHPLLITERCTISELGARVATAGTGLIAFAIYAADPATGNPTGTPLGTTAGVSNATASTVNAALAAPVTLDPGVYWLAALSDSAANYQAAGPATLYMGWAIGGTQAAISAGPASGLQAYTYTATYGTWPDLTSVTPTALSAANYCLVQFLVSSVP